MDILKNNYIKCRMIKNKILNIKMISKVYLKILKTFYVFKHNFILQNLKCLKLFPKTFF